MLSAQEAELTAGISGQRAFEHVRVLISPPERVSGSPAEAEGARKVESLLAPFVDKCELEGVAVTGYLRGEGRLEVTSPVRVSIPGQVNPVTGSGRGEGILVDVAEGSRGEFARAGGRVGGKVVLATGQPFALGGGVGLVAREARNRGAACLVYHMARTSEELIPVHGLNIDFPVLSISSKSAAELRRRLSQYGEVRVSFETTLVRAPGTSYNVVGVIQGSEFPDEFIYLLSHHDTWFYGANDNNATTACLLEVARLFGKQRPRRSLRFVIHGSEESGAEIGSDAIYYDRGSFGYSEQHRRQLEGKGELPIAVINGEMLGYTPRASIQSTPEVLGFVKGAVADHGGEHLLNEPAAGWTSSDHLCYHTLGTPTIYLTPAPEPGMPPPSSYFRLYHTEGDNLAHVSVAALESNARLLALLVARLDAGEGLPYSLEGLLEAAGRGMELVPNREHLKGMLEEKAKRCARARSREGRVRRTLELARVINRNIYGFVGQVFVHKFATLADTVAKLRQAHHLISTGAEREEARQALLSITGAMPAANFSREVLAEVGRLRRGSPLINRLSTFSPELSSLFDQIAGDGSKEAILSNLESRIAESLEVARSWGISFEQSLATL